MVRPPIVIGGPTASGKSALAIALAERIGGEIICADSRQVYAGFAIASAAPTAEELARVPHHGYGVIDPATETMSAGRFIAFADRFVAAITARDRVPILVGGTGLYLRAWRLGLDDGGGARDMDAMIARPPRVAARWLLVDAPLAVLEPHIRARAAQMFDAGLIEESVALSLPPSHKLLETLGTAEARALHAGKLDRAEAVRLTTLRTRQYARRQRTWFKKEPWWTRLDASSPCLLDEALGAL